MLTISEEQEKQIGRVEDLVQLVVKLFYGVIVETRAELDPLGINIEIICASSEKRGLILGKKGRNMQALRRLLRQWGHINNARVNVYMGPRSGTE